MCIYFTTLQRAWHTGTKWSFCNLKISCAFFLKQWNWNYSGFFWNYKLWHLIYKTNVQLYIYIYYFFIFRISPMKKEKRLCGSKREGERKNNFLWTPPQNTHPRALWRQPQLCRKAVVRSLNLPSMQLRKGRRREIEVYVFFLFFSFLFWQNPFSPFLF